MSQASEIYEILCDRLPQLEPREIATCILAHWPKHGLRDETDLQKWAKPTGRMLAKRLLA